MTTAGQDAIRADAERRLLELRRVVRTLWPSRDDPQVLSELVVLLGQVRQAETAIRQITA